MPAWRGPVRRLAAVVTAVLAFNAGSAVAAELLMFEEPRCPWCIKWHREIGPTYDRTDEGRQLPLRRIELPGSRPVDLAGVANIRYSPTFVVVHCGREAGRVIGYAGEEAFWGELGSILRSMDTRPCPRP